MGGKNIIRLLFLNKYIIMKHQENEMYLVHVSKILLMSTVQCNKTVITAVLSIKCIMKKKLLYIVISASSSNLSNIFFNRVTLNWDPIRATLLIHFILYKGSYLFTIWATVRGHARSVESQPLWTNNSSYLWKYHRPGSLIKWSILRKYASHCI